MEQNPSEELTISQLDDRLPKCYGTRMIIIMLITALHLLLS
jgi:hypothetical protein